MHQTYMPSKIHSIYSGTFSSFFPRLGSEARGAVEMGGMAGEVCSGLNTASEMNQHFVLFVPKLP